MSSSGGYVAVPRCPVTFDGTNYAEFVAFMRIHMRGIRLWGVLSGEVPCPPTPVAPVAPTPPTLPVLTADASEADKAAAKTAGDVAMATYDRQVSDYSDAIATYRDDLAAYTQWCDDDARAAAFSLLVFSLSLPLSLWVLVLLWRCGLIFASGINPLVILSTYQWFVRSMLFSRATPLLMSSTQRVLLFGVSLTPSAQLFVVLARAARL